MEYFISRLRLCLCFVLAAMSGICLYIGATPLLSTREASAEAGREPVPAAELCLDLRLDADNAAKILADTTGRADPQERPSLLREGLDALALGPGNASGASFLLWKDTRLLHAPGFPDLAGKSYFGEKDIDGRSFARDLARAAGRGGGFTLFTPAHAKGALLAYSRPLGPAGGPFLSVYLPARFEIPGGSGPLTDLYSGGFCLSGFSFAGLACLCGMRRERNRV